MLEHESGIQGHQKVEKKIEPISVPVVVTTVLLKSTPLHETAGLAPK